MKKIILIAVVVLLAGCCPAPDPQAYVESFYEAIEDGDLPGALALIDPSVDFFDARYDELEGDPDAAAYIESVLALKEGESRSITNLECKGSSILWDEQICAGEDCRQYEMEFLLFEGSIIRITAYLVE